jgi:hypothetical protein
MVMIDTMWKMMAMATLVSTGRRRRRKRRRRMSRMFLFSSPDNMVKLARFL